MVGDSGAAGVGSSDAAGCSDAPIPDKSRARAEDRSKTRQKGTIPEEFRLGGEVCRFEAVRGTGDAEVARLADVQHGCVHRSQLLAAGLGAKAIAHRLANGRLHRLHPKVFLVGRRVSTEFTAAMAAVLSFHGDAVLHAESAAGVWRLTEQAPQTVTVLLVGRNARPLPGVRTRRAKRLDPRDLRWRDGLPVTSPARTLVDLASTLGPAELEAALATALGRRGVRRNQIIAAISRAPRTTKGVRTLRELLAEGERAPADTRSKYERKLLQLIDAAELPRPVTNVTVEGHLVDLYWPRQKLIVEFDGFAHHGDRASFERDRRRDQRLVAAGLRAMRVTARHVDGTPYATVARLAAALVTAG